MIEFGLVKQTGQKIEVTSKRYRRGGAQRLRLSASRFSNVGLIVSRLRRVAYVAFFSVIVGFFVITGVRLQNLAFPEARGFLRPHKKWQRVRPRCPSPASGARCGVDRGVIYHSEGDALIGELGDEAVEV